MTHETHLLARPSSEKELFVAFTLLYVGFVMTRYGIGLRRLIEEGEDA